MNGTLSSSGYSPRYAPVRGLALMVIVILLASFTAAAATSVPDAEQLIGAPRGAPLTGDALLRRTQEVAGAIRCPVCQGLSVADSPSEMAVNMKAQVRELLARGYTREQIESYFERSYGQFVLLRPKFKGVNALVWLLPVLGLVIGVAVVAAAMRKFEQGSPAAVEESQIDPADPYLTRVRDMVKGTRS